jgi:hypothetical protein
LSNVGPQAPSCVLNIAFNDGPEQFGVAEIYQGLQDAEINAQMALDATNGFVAANGIHDLADESLPIFEIEPVQLQFSIAADFVAAQVANNVLVLALSNGRILRIDLNRPEDIDGKLGGSFLNSLFAENTDPCWPR